MVKETVSAVYEAEQNALQAEKDAAKESEEIVRKAQQDAQEMISFVVAQTQAKSDEELVAAKRQGDKFIADAISKVEDEIQAINQTAFNKEKAAIAMIISEIT